MTGNVQLYLPDEGIARRFLHRMAAHIIKGMRRVKFPQSSASFDSWRRCSATARLRS